MINIPLQEVLKDAETAALKAGELIASYQGKTLDVLPKEGGDNYASSIVTEVDIKSQDIIVKHLTESMNRYDLGLLTEEEADDGSRFTKQAFWCVDPIDGTLPFAEGKAGYAVSIGLVSREGESLLGVIYDPLSGHLYTAVKGEGAYRDNQPWSRPDFKSGKALNWQLDRDQIGHAWYEELCRMMEKEVQSLGCTSLDMLNQGGAVLNACWAMENAPGIYFKAPKNQKGGGCFWDFAATACIIKEAGGLVFDFDENPLNLNAENPYMNRKGVVFLSSEELLPLFYKIRTLCLGRKGN